VKPVGFDNTMLSILLNPSGRIPVDPDTGQPILMAQRRAELLVESLARSRQKIIIPTPAQAELLTAIGPTAQRYFDIIARSRLFEVASFDSRCAIELAYLNRDIFATHDPKNPTETYQKIKIDRQIIAIFKVAGVENIYTNDAAMAKRGRLCGLNPIGTAQLELPTEDRQMNIEYSAADEIPEPGDEAED
jgi:predicted nucleic acid-binding protein